MLEGRWEAGSLLGSAARLTCGDGGTESGDEICALLLQSGSLLGKYEEALFAGSYSTD